MFLSVGNSGSYELEAFRAVQTELKDLGHETVHFKQDECLNGETVMFEVACGVPRLLLNIDGSWHDAESFDGI